MAAPRPGCIWTPDGHAILVRNDEPPKPKPRIGMIPYMTDLLRGPAIPARLSPGARRLIAYCCTCQRTVYGTEYQDCQRYGHEMRHMLVPDLSKQKPGAAA